MNAVGTVAAVAAFASVWFGHIAVRKIEFATARLWIPAAAFCLLGLLSESVALVTPGRSASAGFGIIGITLLWDALELYRQQGRVRKGHAPANLRNSRHAAILNEAGSHATTVDLVRQAATRHNTPIA